MSEIYNEQGLETFLNLIGGAPRSAVIPTSQTVVFYKEGLKHKEKVIDEKYHEIFYSYLMPMLQARYDKDHDKEDIEQLLNELKTKIRRSQKFWSKSYAKERASRVIRSLHVYNAIHIVDLTNNSKVPIELLIKDLFDKTVYYGTVRPVKTKMSREDTFLLSSLHAKSKALYTSKGK